MKYYSNLLLPIGVHVLAPSFLAPTATAFVLAYKPVDFSSPSSTHDVHRTGPHCDTDH
jgi:hypothetical protein